MASAHSSLFLGGGAGLGASTLNGAARGTPQLFSSRRSKCALPALRPRRRGVADRADSSARRTNGSSRRTHSCRCRLPSSPISNAWCRGANADGNYGRSTGGTGATWAITIGADLGLRLHGGQLARLLCPSDPLLDFDQIGLVGTAQDAFARLRFAIRSHHCQENIGRQHTNLLGSFQATADQ